MAEGVDDDFVYFRHAPQKRGDPGRGVDVDEGIGKALFQPHEQGLRHDGIADPGGGDDEDFFQVCEGNDGALRRSITFSDGMRKARP